VLNEIISVLKGSDKIAILPHIAADGDALGSCLALALALQKLNKKPVVFLEEDIPQIYRFLPGIQMAKVYERSSTNFDTAIALDTGDIGRLGIRREIFDSSKVTVNIDHHNTNSEFAFHNYISSSASAVGEIIYQLIKMLGLELNPDMAVCLYVAITTDTGGFRFSNTTPLTHQIISDLIKNGVNVAEISQRVFDSTSYEKVKLMGAAINALELVEKGKVAVMLLTNEIIKQTGAREEDCDGIISIGRNIRGVEVAALLRQWDNGEIKVNLRSNSNVDVSAIAGLYSGGGHKKAAGYITKGSLIDAKQKLLDDIREVL
jgi:bifunctional oligoribonuclease and PAP phosphatase NrnA